MNCYCGRGETRDLPEVACINCEQRFHKGCYKETEDKGFFYCESCMLYMMEPLVNNSVDLAVQEIRPNVRDIVAVPFELTDEQMGRLSNKSVFLNMFMVVQGQTLPEPEELNLYIGGAAITIVTGRFNFVDWSKIAKNYRPRNRYAQRHNFNVSISLNESKANKVFYISLATLERESTLYADTLDRRASKLSGSLKTQSLKGMLEKSKGKSVPLAIPVTCPLTTVLMEYPGKGIYCKHPEFFCIKSYITLNLKKDSRELKWRCPLCKHRVFFNELFLDDLMQETIRKHMSYFCETEMDDSLESAESREEDMNRPSNEVEKSNKLYLLDGQIVTHDELQLLLKAHKPSTRNIQVSTSRTNFDSWSSIIGKPDFSPLPNPNSDLSKKKEEWIVISKSVSGKASPEGEPSQLGRNKGLQIELHNQKLSSIRVINMPVQPNKESSIRMANELDSPRLQGEAERNHQQEELQSQETLVKKMTNTLNIAGAEDDSSSVSNFQKFSESEKKEVREEPLPSIRQLRAFPTRPEWTQHFMVEFPDSIPLLETIMEFPNNLANISDQIYLISGFLNRLPPDVDVIVKFGWCVAQNINPFSVPKIFGQIIGSICGLYKQPEEIVPLMIKYLKEKEVLLPLAMEDFIEKLIPMSDKVDRLALFVFGWVTQPSALYQESSIKKNRRATLSKAIQLSKMVLGEYFSNKGKQLQSADDHQKAKLEQLRVHFILATCQLLAKYIVYALQPHPSEEAEEGLFLELFYNLDDLEKGELVRIRNNHNLLV